MPRQARPVSVLSLLPKVFKTIICENRKNQVNPFLGKKPQGFFLPKKSFVSNLLELSQRGEGDF